MCTASFAGILKKMPHNRLREKIAVNDPLSRKLGYAGLADPLGDYLHKKSGTKSLSMKRAERMGERASGPAPRRAGPATHVNTIAARRVSGG